MQGKWKKETLLKYGPETLLPSLTSFKIDGGKIKTKDKVFL